MDKEQAERNSRFVFPSFSTWTELIPVGIRLREKGIKSFRLLPGGPGEKALSAKDKVFSA